MKTTFRKITALVLTAILALTVVPTCAFAEESISPKYETQFYTLVNGTSSTDFTDGDVIYAACQLLNLTTDTTYEVGLYAAQYRYGELVNVWGNIMTVEPDKSKGIDCTFANIGDFKDSYIYVMMFDPKTFELYAEPIVMKYNDTPRERTLYLVGDSIVQSYVAYPYPLQGWGYYIDEYLTFNLKVDNRGKSGWTTDHYLYPDAIYTREDGLYEYGIELRKKDKADGTPGALKTVGEADRKNVWSQIYSELKEGDYVLLSLGINDATGGNVPLDRYEENLKTIYAQATEKGATLIFATPTIYGSDWDEVLPELFVEDRAVYTEKMKEVAAELGIKCLPLGASLVDLYNGLVKSYAENNPNATEVECQQYARGYFNIYGPVVTTPIAEGGFGYKKYDRWGSTADDPQHHNVRSADDIALLILKLAKDENLSLAEYIDWNSVDAHIKKELHKDGLCKVYDNVKPVK